MFSSTMSICLGGILVTGTEQVSAASQASAFAGKSYCASDSNGTRKVTFTRQSGGTLLGSISAYGAGSEKVWTKSLVAGRRPGAGLVSVNGDQMSMSFTAPSGAQGESDSLTIDYASDSFQGSARAASGTGFLSYHRC